MKSLKDLVYLIYQAYVGSCKSISLSVEEILARKIGITESYFADESDESDEESDEEAFFEVIILVH